MFVIRQVMLHPITAPSVDITDHAVKNKALLMPVIEQLRYERWAKIKAGHHEAADIVHGIVEV